MEHFSLDLVDSVTGVILPKTKIGDVWYVPAEYGQEIRVRASVDDLKAHQKSNPRGKLRVDLKIEGKPVGYSASYRKGNRVTFDYTGGRALVFTRPEMVFFFDVEDKIEADEDLEARERDASVGLIDANFRQTERKEDKGVKKERGLQ